MTFVKGQSGNPNGRPKRRDVVGAMLDELKRVPPGEKVTNAVLLARTAVEFSIAGNARWAKLLMEYVYGKPVQPVEIEMRAYAEQIASVIGADPSDIINLAERRKAS